MVSYLRLISSMSADFSPALIFFFFSFLWCTSRHGLKIYFTILSLGSVFRKYDIPCGVFNYQYRIVATLAPVVIYFVRIVHALKDAHATPPTGSNKGSEEMLAACLLFDVKNTHYIMFRGEKML